MHRAVVAGLLALNLLPPVPARAAPDYPTKTVRLVVNFPAGGPLDLVSREVAMHLRTELGQSFVVENKTGAGGNIGAQAVAGGAADGYNILMTLDSTLTVNPALYKSMPFRIEALKPLMILSKSGMALVVPASSPIRSVSELLATGTQAPVTFASGGNGSPGHIASSMLARTTGMKIMHVPYKGNSPAIAALLGNEVQAALLAPPAMLDHIRSERIRALGVTGSQRSPTLPDLPTLTEQGLKDVDLDVLYMAALPASTPADIVAVLEKAFRNAMAQPAVQQRLKQLDMVPVLETGKVAEDHVATLRSRHARVVSQTGMKLD